MKIHGKKIAGGHEARALKNATHGRQRSTAQESRDVVPAVEAPLPVVDRVMAAAMQTDGSAGALQHRAKQAGAKGKVHFPGEIAAVLGAAKGRREDGVIAASGAGQVDTKSDREVEIKLELHGATEAKALVALLGAPQATLAQVNVYFDAPDGSFRARGWGVRVRKENDAVVLTLKANQKSIGEFLDRNEWNGDVDKAAWADISTGHRAVGALVDALAKERGIPIPAELSLASLQALGSIETVRQVFTLPGDGAPVHLELDRTTYQDRSVIHEVEVESPASDIDRTRARLAALFAAAGIEWRVSKTTKQARFHAIRKALAGPAGR
ncbi:MAG: CYTH domain-containing protein [Deltaproteobacteria bacterium]|nr:CYTH domain-containing protein [Deltaproteobacteria bacterium]